MWSKVVVAVDALEKAVAATAMPDQTGGRFLGAAPDKAHFAGASTRIRAPAAEIRRLD
jgi:hypothetical protein